MKKTNDNCNFNDHIFQNFVILELNQLEKMSY